MKRQYIGIMVQKHFFQKSTEEDNIKVNVTKQVVWMERECDVFSNLLMAEVCINDVG